jgi:Asp-tRNA(Asn)/Glu-tRNA(Gln) amidotransferase A subunit family amidase
MERAGAIIMGKTNSPTMGLRGTCDNFLFGPTRNPFDLRKNAGGSSGGSAAAVADGLVPFAEGTDAGGSIRIPAAWCNVVGFKASFGRNAVVMRPNAFGGAMPFMGEGPISRTVEDAALTLSVLAEYDARDPFSIESNEDFVAATRRSIKGWKIAYSPDLDVYPVAPEVRAVVDKAVEVFADAGATVERVKLGLKRNQSLGPLDRAAQHHRARGHEGGRHRPFGPAPRRLSAGISALDRCRPEAFGDGCRPRPGDPHGSVRRDPGRPRRAPDPGVTDARLHAGRQRHRRQHHRTDPRQR